MKINKLTKITKEKNRLGRGSSSKGNTCSRGNKGQKSRSGYSKKKLFEGGQTPFFKTVPKIGFKKTKNFRKFFLNNNSEIFFLNYKSETFIINILYSKIFIINFNISKSLKKMLEFNFSNVSYRRKVL